MPHPTQIQSPNSRRARTGFRPVTFPSAGMPVKSVSPSSTSIPTVVSPRAKSAVSIIKKELSYLIKVLITEMRKMAGQFYWVVAHLGSNDVLSGPFLSAQEANNEGFRASCPFDLFEYPTKDRTRATQMYKREKFTRGTGLAESLEPISHQMPEASEERETV